MATSKREFIFKDGLQGDPRKARANPIPKEIWEYHRKQIYQKYMTDNLPLWEVVQYMKLNHNFQATERQYTARFAEWHWAKHPTYQRRSTTRSRLDPLQHASLSLVGASMTSELAKLSSVSPDSPAGFYCADMLPTQAGGYSGNQGFNARSLSNICFKKPEQSHTQNELDPRSTESLAKSLDGTDLDVIGCFETSGHRHEWEPPEASMQALSLEDRLEVDSDVEVGYEGLHCPDIQTPMKALHMNQGRDVPRLVVALPPTPTRVLHSILHNSYFQYGMEPLSEDDIGELTSATNFLSAAESYHDSFNLGLATWHLSSPKHAMSLTAMLSVLKNLARSAISLSCLEELMGFTQLLNMTDPDLKEQGHEVDLLFAYQLSAIYKHFDAARALKAVATTRHKLRVISPAGGHPVARHVNATIDETMLRSNSYESHSLKNPHEGLETFTTAYEEPTHQIMVDQDIPVLLTWISRQLFSVDFETMVSNIDEGFWTHEPKLGELDILRAQQIVIYCYLCEKIWQIKRLHRTKMLSVGSDASILMTLERLCSPIGLSCEDLLAAVLEFVSSMSEIEEGEEERSEEEDMRRSAFPKLLSRFHGGIVSFRTHPMENLVRCQQNSHLLTLEKLLECHMWAGISSDITTKFQNTQYGERIRTFLQDFISDRFEQDLSHRIQLYDNCFRSNGNRDHVRGASQSVRSSQLSSDFAAFRAMARPTSDSGAMSLTDSQRRHTASPGDMFSETSSTRRLRGYSMSIGNSNNKDTMSISGSSLTSAKRGRGIKSKVTTDQQAYSDMGNEAFSNMGIGCGESPGGLLLADYHHLII